MYIKDILHQLKACKYQLKSSKSFQKGTQHIKHNYNDEKFKKMNNWRPSKKIMFDNSATNRLSERQLYFRLLTAVINSLGINMVYINKNNKIFLKFRLKSILQFNTWCAPEDKNV